MTFPDLNPVAFSIGPLVVRWYALAYLAGIILGWRWCMSMAKRDPNGILKPEYYDEFLSWAVLGVILGGRIGYILFYNFGQYASDPFEMLRVWHGGMSFHGGAVGVIFAAYIFARVKHIPFFAFSDLIACATPIGLFFGRLANFVNGELFGRVTDVPWGIIFPRGGPMPRHPSQIYEAAAEGLFLLFVMFVLSRQDKVRQRIGFLSGLFLTLYGVLRFSLEFFREPDAQLGFLFAGATMGQLLCIPMVVAGLIIIVWSGRKSAHERA